jgi:hypothetical protein
VFAGVLSDDAKNALAILGKHGVVSEAYLAGGSALALHYGHRKSEDLDFFSPKPFDPHAMSATLSTLGQFVESFAEGRSLIGEFQGVKYSYFQYHYPLLYPTVSFSAVSLADPRDIAAMKIAAIMDRGTKRDFVDLYEFCHTGISIENILTYYDRKYGAFENNLFSIVRSLGYFDDAEKGDMPEMLISISWEDVKEFFAAESIRLGKVFLTKES